MTVSKAFWKIVVKNIGVIVTYTIILVMFGTINMSSNSSTAQFEAVKPKIAVFNHDSENAFTNNLLEYLDKNAEIQQDYSEDSVKDDLFYEAIVMAIDIPENYGKDFVAGKNPELHTRTSSGYAAELAKVMLNKYLATAQSYTVLDLPADELAEKINKVLDNEIEVETLSKIDTTQFAKPTRYFNFANYAILACVITIICLIMGSFNRREIRRRNLVSAIEISKMNGALLRNSCLYSFGVWLFYVVIGYFLVGSKELLNLRGVLYLANSLAFCICATTIAYLISRLISGRNATNAVMNIVALGSSFLCGCFVPAEYLPDFVLTFAHILPSYYYVAANDKIGTLQGLEFSDIRPVLINIVIILGFSVAFVIAANIISKAKQRE